MTGEANQYRIEHSDAPDKPTTVLIYEPTGVVVTEKWKMDGPNSPLHRVGKPAVISRDAITGAVKSVEYYRSGMLHRTDGPANIEYADATGKVRDVSYYIEGRLDRTDGPAHITYADDGSIKYECWYKKDERHRIDGPAEVFRSNGIVCNEKYYQDGFPHRLDGPAEIVRNPDNGIVCSEFWRVWGPFYRVDGGATSRLYDSETGALRRENFQAVDQEPTRSQALQRRLRGPTNVTFIDLML